MNLNIIKKVENGVGWLTFNRADKLNALSVQMINELFEIFKSWKNDDQIKLIVLEGAGEKAFCVGGDVRHLYDHRDKGVDEVAFNFFYTEYRMNMLIHTFSKPILVYMNGLVMGGGVGVAVAGTHRIVTENTKWAMPEMNIGFYPDVGGSYFFNKMPHHIGRYLALTSFVIKAADVLYSGAADYYMSSSEWQKLRAAISECDWANANVVQDLEAKVSEYVSPCPEPAPLEDLAHDIESHFGQNSLESIVNSLEVAAESGDSWAGETAKSILSKSPTSLKVTLEQLVRGEKLAIRDCLIMELNMSMNFMNSNDFFEGVSSVLVNKHRNPKWVPNTLKAVSIEDVTAFFTYDWKNAVNPLANFDI